MALSSIVVAANSRLNLLSLQHRLSRGRSRERGRHSPGGDSFHSTDYAADNSSEHSSSAVTPSSQSPRHRATTIGDSPLVRSEVPNGRNDRLALNKSQLSVDQGGVAQEANGFSAAPLEFLQCDESQKRREIALRQHSFFQLRIQLVSGRNLTAMDKNGTSDPYVKFKMGGRLLYKSRTMHRELNPRWEETFMVPVEDPFQGISIKVFDYDWGLQDDFMGSAQLELTALDLNQCHDIVLKLIDPARPDRDLGELHLTATLWPRTQEDKEQVSVGGRPRSSFTRKLLIGSSRLPSLARALALRTVLLWRYGGAKVKVRRAPRNEGNWGGISTLRGPN